MMADKSTRRRASPSSTEESACRSSLRMVETVNSEGSWCCIPRLSSHTSTPSTPLSLNYKLKDRHKAPAAETFINVLECQNKEDKPEADGYHRSQNVVESRMEWKSKSGDLNKIGDAFKNGEIAALIKQGFISAGSPLDRGNGSPFKVRLSHGRVSPLLDSAFSISPKGMGFSKSHIFSNQGANSSSPPIDKSTSSPTLFEMMTYEHENQKKPRLGSDSILQGPSRRRILRKQSLEERPLFFSSPGSKFNDIASADVKLTLTSGSKDGPSVTIHVHQQTLVEKSGYFAAKLSEISIKESHSTTCDIHISDCEDVEAYIDTLSLMYCTNLTRKLMKESISRVLSILKVSATLIFEAGVLSCLEYLEAVPWAEEEEGKVSSLLGQLQLEKNGAGEVLKRLSIEEAGGSQDILLRLLHLVIKGTDEKARREMKGLVSRMLRENAEHGRGFNDLSKESLYDACQGCLDSLLLCFTQTTTPEFGSNLNEELAMLMGQITRHADNLAWLLDILIDRQIADDFVRIWAYQELSALHNQVPLALGRYEVSRLTARLCVAVGQGEIMAPKEIRFQLLQNWLQPLIDDFGWMQRACRGLDKKVIEEGISQTILTLPLKQQQFMLTAWFDRFLKNGDDCPNLQKAFEIWWRRTFVRPQSSPTPSLMQCIDVQDSSCEAASLKNEISL
ncbi:hypothetical protein KP509_37G060600 [Ceratopteris richardii]|uniref:BTB domain-containing protein n=1 Tax=Ceratopteris richardii TaxID=49495 RepID=A0A8T2QAP2_CERRI|nr:hypothetical protein KP509_37G060600 [Ceratopteris richardii]